MERILDKVILSATLQVKPKCLLDSTTLKQLIIALVILSVATFIVNRLQTWFSNKIVRSSFVRQILYVLLSLVMGVVVYGIAFYILVTFVEKSSLNTVIIGSIIYSCLHTLFFMIKDGDLSLIKLIDDDEEPYD